MRRTLSGRMPVENRHRRPRGVQLSNHHSLTDTVNVALVSRGEKSRLATALRAIYNLLVWTASPERLRFHILADKAVLAEHARASLVEHSRRAGVTISKLSERLVIVNATDAALECKLSPGGREWLHHVKLQDKAHTYTVLKLFLYEVLPRNVPRALLLDTDLYAMADVCELWDAFAAATTHQPSVVLGCAYEGQSAYRMMWLDALSGPEASGYNGGVCVHILERMHTSSAWHELLSRLAELMYLETPGKFDMKMLARMVDLGDQTALSLAAGVAPDLWKALFSPLPCEWNWQVCIDWYANAKYLNRVWSFKARALRANQYDSSCHQPPKLLHFNGGSQWKQAFSRLNLVSRGSIALSHNLAVVQRVLRVSRDVCGGAEQTVPGIASRACNASFLLQRHFSHLNAMGAI